ncbi:TPA: ribonuclease J [Candidatus Saccharibacteria bacterium]|nr:ribonuclease J [Candidatus Saccharibacteria bacterium]HIO87740.1 ribonuclease J [Candidatus Saccharibacteria bacterium]
MTEDKKKKHLERLRQHQAQRSTGEDAARGGSSNSKPSAKKPASRNNNTKQNGGAKKTNRIQTNGMETHRGQAIRASRRTHEMADKLIEIHNVQEISPERRANVKPLTDKEVLRLTPLGGQDGIGEKNMQVLEYGDTAVVIDCGMDLGIDLPGVNFGIPDASYLDKIKHKLKGYIITHGHLDHIGGMPYVVPKYPAPIYGSHFTIGMVKKVMGDRERGVEVENFEPEFVEMNMDNHEKLKLGDFYVELIRMTHSIPDSSAVVIETPLGRVINSGDFRLDPEPLDHRPSDVERLKEFGKDGKTLLLMSDSTNSQKEGRTPTESTLEPSFHDIITKAEGRVFVASFSSNMNRIQMIINAAVAAGRKVAIDGRSMLSTLELAVKLGTIKVPRGTVTTLKSMPNLPDREVLVVQTGGQGELNASLQRMSVGEHQYLKLKEGDTVVISSTPIPGNNVRYDQISDDLIRLGVRLYRAPTHKVDGVGPLHVSGHASREEQLELIDYVKPKYFIPIYAGPLHRKYHMENAIYNGGFDSRNTFMLDAGETMDFVNGVAKYGPKVPVGTQLVDNTGSLVPSVVVKDRVVLAEDGVVTVIVTVDRKSGRLLTSPDIITRGFIYMRDNAELMDGIRNELKRAVNQRFKRVELDRFKQELKDHITHFLFEHTRRSPMVIPVVNAIGSNGKSQIKPKPKPDASH